MEVSGSFEIFRKTAKHEPKWLESCSTLESATERAAELAPDGLGDYLIFDRKNQRFIGARRDQLMHTNTRILVADDYKAVREGICSMLRGRENVEVVGEASNGKEAIEKTRSLQPDVIIMDWSMPVMDGLSAAQIIKKFSPETAILVFTMHASRVFAELVKRMGLDGFVTKGEGAPELLLAIDEVMHHQKHFPA